MDLDKTVFITGGSRGIGAAIAEAFAAEGCRVAINCRKAGAESEATLEKCRAHGVRAELFTGDVADFAACGKMIEQVQETLGPVDVLINNAGITRDGLIARMSEESFDEVIAVNLKSMFNTIRHVTPGMMKRRAGCIINMSSVVGVHGNSSQINYAAAKAGVIGLTKSTAKELGRRGITCNAIAPGFIETPMTDSLPEELKKAMLEATSLRRFGRVEDVAETAVFLARSSYITGQVILVDGGLQM